MHQMHYQPIKVDIIFAIGGWLARRPLLLDGRSTPRRNRRNQQSRLAAPVVPLTARYMLPRTRSKKKRLFAAHTLKQKWIWSGSR